MTKYDDMGNYFEENKTIDKIDWRTLCSELANVLEKTSGYFACLTEDMAFYYEDKAIPTIEETIRLADSWFVVRQALAKYNAAIDRDQPL